MNKKKKQNTHSFETKFIVCLLLQTRVTSLQTAVIFSWKGEEG